MGWGQKTFPDTPMTKGSDEALVVSVGEDGGTRTVNCDTYEWTSTFSAMHKVWISQDTGLVIKEVQRQAGGPNPYPASAEVNIAYDAELPQDMFSVDPSYPDLFAPPAACSGIMQKASVASLMAVARDFAPHSGASAYVFVSLVALAAVGAVAGLWRRWRAAQSCMHPTLLVAEE